MTLWPGQCVTSYDELFDPIQSPPVVVPGDSQVKDGVVETVGKNQSYCTVVVWGAKACGNYTCHSIQPLVEFSKALHSLFPPNRLQPWFVLYYLSPHVMCAVTLYWEERKESPGARFGGLIQVQCCLGLGGDSSYLNSRQAVCENKGYWQQYIDSGWMHGDTRKKVWKIPGAISNIISAGLWANCVRSVRFLVFVRTLAGTR